METDEEKRESDSNFKYSRVTDPQPSNQTELNNLVRDLNLSKDSSEILASHLKEKHLLTLDTKIRFYRTCKKDFLASFSL